MIKQMITLTEIPQVEYNRYTRSHNSGTILVKICIFEWLNEKNLFSKTKYIFIKKQHHNYWDILGYKI